MKHRVSTEPDFKDVRPLGTVFSQSTVSLGLAPAKQKGINVLIKKDHSLVFPDKSTERLPRRLAIATTIIEGGPKPTCPMCSKWQEKGADGVRRLLLEIEHLRRAVGRLMDAMETLVTPAKFAEVHAAIHLNVHFYTHPEVDSELTDLFDFELDKALSSLSSHGPSKTPTQEIALQKQLLATLNRKVLAVEAQRDELIKKVAVMTPRKPAVVNQMSSFNGQNVRVLRSEAGCQTDPWEPPPVEVLVPQHVAPLPQKVRRVPKSKAVGPKSDSEEEPLGVKTTRRIRSPKPGSRCSSRCTTADHETQPEPAIASEPRQRSSRKHQNAPPVAKRGGGDAWPRKVKEEASIAPPRPETVDQCTGGGPGPGLADMVDPPREAGKKKDNKREETVANLFSRQERAVPKLSLGSASPHDGTSPHERHASPSQLPKFHMSMEGFFSQPSGAGIAITGKQ